MQKRGTLARAAAERRALSLLLERTPCSLAELAKAAGVSRPTAYAIVEELDGMGLLRRDGGAEKGISLRPEQKFIFLKLYSESAELVCYSPSRAAERTAMAFVPSMEYGENAARLASIAERYAAELRDAGELRACVICRSGAPDLVLPKIFGRALCSDELLSESVGDIYAKKSLLYLDGVAGRAVLTYGKSLLSSVELDGKRLCDKLSKLLELCPPNIIAQRSRCGSRGGDESAEIAELCRAHGSEFLLFDDRGLLPDEKEAALRLMLRDAQDIPVFNKY